MTNKKPNAQHGLFLKSATLIIRLTVSQKYELYRLAKSQGLTMSAYVLKQLGIDDFELQLRDGI